MNIRVRLFALYREVVGEGQVDMEVRQGTTPTDVWRILCQNSTELADQSHTWRVAVNSEYADPDATLSHDDEVAFIPPLSGG